MTTRDDLAGRAMVVLLSQHPTATRGWIAEMAYAMADVMIEASERPIERPRQAESFNHAPRLFADDEALYRAEKEKRRV